MSVININNLIKNRVHFGHKKRYWNSSMKPYIYGLKNGVHIINLEKTVPLFKKSLNFIKKIISSNGKILFIGTKDAAYKEISRQAKKCGMPYVSYRWLGGMLTNYKTINKSIKKFKDLKLKKSNGEFDKLIKKEALQKNKILQKLKKNINGIKDMGGLPDAVFVIDTNYEKTAILESRRLLIPIIAIADTNSNINDIDHIIPGNDDSRKSIKFYLKVIASKILEFKNNKNENLNSNEVKITKIKKN